ncbi:MAG: S58 family peptidase, partial [Candidatus Moranbacteria bacterium]|nr:S58 family peptidase [Candidatus Moranbacteria bacterium]
VLAFSTANTISKAEDDFAVMKVLNENKMDILFRAIAESTEEAILSSMINSTYTVGYGNHHRYSLRDYLYLLNP